MSSPAGPQPSESGFLSRWIPSSSRAGVFLSGSPGEVGSVRSSCSSLAQEISLADSFCSQFAPLPVSLSSSLDPVVPEVSETEPETSRPGSDPDNVQNILRRVQELPLMARLEQLKQLQQRMQEQLKAHQLGQLQKLQNDQQSILGLVQTGTGYNQEKQQYSGSTSSALSPAQHGVLPPTHQQEGLSELESSVWNHEPSVVQSSFGQDADEEDVMIEGSLQSVIEDQSMCRKDSEAEPQDRPIRSTTSGKTFEEMLEEQLKLENEKINKNTSAEAAKAKRPFLRRGEGLARFTRGKAVRSSREGTTRSNTKPTSCPNPVTSRSQAVATHHQSSQPKRPSSKSTTSTNAVIQRKTAVLNKENFPQNKASVPATKTVAKSHVLVSHQGQNLSSGAVQQLGKNDKKPDPQQKNICDAMVEKVNKGQSSGPVRDPRASVAENSFEVWLTERGDRWEKDHQRECVELGEFELLERAADELSFSSNSSFICTLLQGDRRRLSSTPVKLIGQQPTLPGHRQDVATGTVQPSICNVQQCLPDLPMDSVAVSIKKNVVISEYSEDEDEEDKMDEDSDASLCSSSEFHQTAFGPSQPFSHCFQVSQVPPYDKSSYQDREGGAASPLEEEESNGDSTLVSVRDHFDFDDDDTWNEPEDLTCVSTTMDDHVGKALTRKVASSKGAEPDASTGSSLDRAPEPPPTCQLVAKLFPALKPKTCPSAPPSVVQDPEGTHSEHGAAQSRLLRERLVELETEIERFKAENAALSRIRQENEAVKENLRKERTEFQQKMADELAKWEEFKREEGRKLQRDKKLFEKHAAAARARPDKQERDEIQSLKQQLNTLQEDLRKRETRWSSTHNRLRQQVDSLTAENASLRDQVRLLEKLRLTAWKNAEGEREKERGRSSAPGSGCGSISSTTTTSTAQKRAKSKSPSCSVKTSRGNGRRDSPDLQKPPKTQACNSKPKTSPSQKEACPAAAPYHLLDAQTQPVTETSLEEESPGVVAEQLEMEEEEIMHTDGKIEKLLPDGGRLIVFPNGTRKELSADGLSVKVTFFNGDIKQIMPDQRVIYYHAGAQTTHTTYPDGMEVLQFPNNQIEKHFPDGHKEITFPDQTVKNIYPDGREESVLADGTIIQQNPDGSKKIQFNTGQRELHTAEFKRREYPDGTVKTVYSDGRQETRYPSGRVRLKDPQGRVVMDAKP
ncbi:centrosomal P4.1-associated protein [Salminus brasiliensis]|uniref:centrosomal P4.1-associated protein n=1 Tax=Salminus brasiliensis TaxID=930266 RepID=UPI003B836AA9